jgi:hypothetical protein
MENTVTGGLRRTGSAFNVPNMATIRDRKISTTSSFNYNNVKEIPELGLPALLRIHSCGVPSVASVTTSSSVEPVTKQPSCCLKKAHLVNAVFKDILLKKDIVSPSHLS